MAEKMFAIRGTRFGLYRLDYRGEVVVGLKRVEEFVDGGFETEFSKRLFGELAEYFAGERTTFDFEVDFGGCTPFQQDVLRELQRIPYGETRSYKDVAIAIGRPKAARAVGMACNRNPICIAIPCHRVVGANSALVGYVDGVQLKSSLLTLEHQLRSAVDSARR